MAKEKKKKKEVVMSDLDRVTSVDIMHCWQLSAFTSTSFTLFRVAANIILLVFAYTYKTSAFLHCKKRYYMHSEGKHLFIFFIFFVFFMYTSLHAHLRYI